jgi:uncharacterized protein
VGPVEISSKTFVSAPEQRRSDECRCETVQGAVSRTGQWLLLALVQLYRIFLSPFLGGACKFYPSCSQYAQEAIARHGAKRGSWLALKRLGRCRPFTRGGFDPVPDLGWGYGDVRASDAQAGAEKPRATGLAAASRDRCDYSDAEWLRTANKELAQ